MHDGALTTPALLDRMACELPSHPALMTEDRTLSFAELRHEARRAAAAMIARGVRAGDGVAIWSPNTWHWVVAALGTHYAGAVLIPLNTRYTATEAADILARSRARLLVALDRIDGIGGLGRFELPALTDIARVPAGSADPDWASFLNGPAVDLGEVDDRAAAVRPEDVADVFFTSGTTGQSKGVMCAHRQSLAATAAVWSATGGLDCSDRYLCVNPFFHAFGYKFAILACLQAGAALFPQRTFDPEAAMAAVAEQRITVFPGPPAVFQALLDHPRRRHYDLTSWRLAVTGATTLPVTLIERLQKDLDVDTVITGYGLTEASGYGTTCRPHDDPVTVATTCGRPVPGFELRIDGSGEVLLRGPNVMLGYLDDPPATREAIDSEGWLHTGDIGALDEAGNLRVTGRLTDMYLCGGFNVYPAEIEQLLYAMDEVAEAAVIGVPDSRLGEVGRAFAVLRPGAALAAAEVLAHLRAHLADFKVPRRVTFLDRLPRNPAGKVLKTELRQASDTPASPVKPQGLGGPPVGRVERWVADIWQVLLNIEMPGRRDDFNDLGGDSIAAAEFLVMLREQFGVSISLDSLASRPTIAAVVAGLQPGESTQRQPIVRLRQDDSGPVCLMIPGIAGHAWLFTSLAGELTGPCDVRALSLMDLHDGSRNELIARIRAAAGDALQPDSVAGRPVVVIGYSFGAAIAADVACWLIEHGTPVDKLILLDPDPLDSSAPLGDFDISHSSATHLIFLPGSAAARQLEDDIVVCADALQNAYRGQQIRLPPVAMSWLQSTSRSVRDAAAPTIFGTPVDDVAKTVLDLHHLHMLRIPEVYPLAAWLDEQLPSSAG